LATPYASRYGGREDIPKFRIPHEGVQANAAYQLIHDELEFDGHPNLNVASYVSTYMVPSAADILLTKGTRGGMTGNGGGITVGQIDDGEYVQELG
jgi:glutamate/tyrosine decarboxylase-like PLP-dependent enzyme